LPKRDAPRLAVEGAEADRDRVAGHVHVQSREPEQRHHRRVQQEDSRGHEHELPIGHRVVAERASEHELLIQPESEEGEDGGRDTDEQQPEPWLAKLLLFAEEGRHTEASRHLRLRGEERLRPRPSSEPA
jgi:hypothetical protein